MVSAYFNPAKRYKEDEFQEGQFIASEDFNLVQDMQNYDKRELHKFLQGFQLKINAMVNSPVLKVKANNLLTEGQVITIEVVDVNNVKWRKNGGAWSGNIAVTFNNVTWNTLGTSGLEVVLKTSPTAADTSEVWVAQAMRLLGGEIENTAPGTFRVNAGKWGILGEFESFVTPLVAVGCANLDYLYIQATHVNVDYTVDSTLGHRLADGNYSDKSPIAVQRAYSLLSAAVFPANTSSPFVENICVGKVIDAAAGTFTSMWNDPLDVQQFLRIYGDTTAPLTPTGLVLTTGSDQNLVDAALAGVRIIPQIPLSGYLTMVCNDNAEADIDYYEFKITRLVSIGGALTTDSIVQLVKTNVSAGGMSVPLGISYTLHGQQFGVPYRVWVRAVDFAGNVSAWSVSSDVVIGGTTCEIAAIDPGPTFTLIDTPGFVGVTFSVTAVPIGAEGYTIWIGEGVYPDPVLNEGFIGHYNASVGVVNVPWKENGQPYVRIKAYDQNGLYQTLYSQDNTSLEASAQLAVLSHNENLSSHGGTISDIITCQGPHGSLYRWLNTLSGSAWAPGGVYVLAKSGSSYTTLESCFNAIATDAPPQATIFVMPGIYGAGGTYVIPALPLTRVTIIGLGKNTCNIADEIDISSVAGGSTSLPPSLIFQNLTFFFDFIGTAPTGKNPAITFDNCEFILATSAGYCFTLLTTGSGAFFLRFNSCRFRGDANPLLLFEAKVNFIFSDCQFVNLSAAVNGACVFLKSPTSSVRLFKNCAFQIPVASASYAVDASGAGIPYSIWAYGNAWVIAPTAGNITVQEGTVAINTVIASVFLTG